MGSWLAAARPGKALLAPLAAAVGTSYAHFDAQPPGLPAGCFVAAGALAAALGVNLAEHAWDRAGASMERTASGDPGHAEPIDSRDAMIAGCAAFAVAALCGVALIPFSGAAAIGYGLFATALGVARRAPVVGLDTLGWGLGDVASVAAWGPLAALAGFSSQAGSGSTGAFLVGLPAGLISASVLFARHFTNREADARFGRVTPVVSLGEDQARLGLVAFPLMAAAAVAVAMRLGEYGPWAWLATPPLALAAVWAWRIPASSRADGYVRWEHVANPCAAASLLCIAVAIWLASPN